jgi:t-SNARE complex subunit (syntaxin)
MTELELLERIAKNTTDIKAFCYAFSVVIALLVVVFVFSWLVRYVIGSKY